MLTVCAVSLALCARWLVAVVASREAALPAPSVPMMVASDVVLLVALVRALSTRRVRWRDRELVLTPRGALVEADPGRRLRA